MLARNPETDPTAALVAENEELHEQVAMLRRALGLVRDDEVQSALIRRWALTGRESQILVALHLKRGAVASKEHLMQVLYAQSPDEPEIKIVDVFVCKLRRKMGSDYIQTVWGRGYALTPMGLEEVARIAATPLPEIMPVKNAYIPQVYRGGARIKALRMFAAQGPAIISEIARYLRVPTSNVWAHTHAMEKQGLLERSDRRPRMGSVPGANMYRLTPAGVAELKKTEHVHVD